MFLTILKDTLELLQSIEWPETCEENVSGAMTYLSCAIQNLIDAGY